MAHNRPEHITALRRAANQKRSEDKPTVSEVFAEYGRDRYSDADIDMALRDAIVFGRLHAVAALIEHGAVADRVHAMAAGRFETPEILEVLFKNKVSQEVLGAALSSAAAKGHPATLDWLLERGADPKFFYDDAFITAAHTGQLDMLKRLESIAGMDLRTRNLILRAAIKRGDVAMLEWIVTLKPDYDLEDSAPLRAAIKQNNTRMVEALMAAGAKPVRYPKTQQEHDLSNQFFVIRRPFNPEIAKAIHGRYSEIAASPTPPKHEIRVALSHPPEDQPGFNAEIAALFRASQAKNSPSVRPPLRRRLP